MIENIISLKEVSTSKWHAQYRGNYGIYTIKTTMGLNNKTTNFNCSCPSDYYPCKHIAVVETAIRNQIAENQDITNKNTLSVDDLLREVSHKDLLDFIINESRYNHHLKDFIHISQNYSPKRLCY